MAGPTSRSRLAVLAALALTGLGLAAIGLASPARAVDKIRFGVVEAKGDAGILFMPAQFGSRYGLDIEMVQFASSTTPVKALIAGDIDAFTTSPGVALIAMSRGAKLKFVGCDWPGATYTLYGGPGVKSVADLKGKSVGVSGPGSMPDLWAREVLADKGVPESQVVFANAGGGSDRFRALTAGVVKATATTSEFVPEAQKRGMTVLAQAHDLTPNFARNCIVTSDKVLATKHDALVRLLAARMDGLNYVISHPKETAALARQVAKLPASDPSPEYIYAEAIREHDLDPKLAIVTPKLQWIEDMLARHKIIDRSVDVKAFVDDGPREAALKLVKP